MSRKLGISRNSLLFLLALLALYIVGLRTLLGVGVMIVGDLGDMPTDFRFAYDAVMSSWQPWSLGTNLRMLPSIMYYWLLSSISGRPDLAQKIFYFSLMPLANITMYRLLRDKVKSHWARAFGSLVYAVNPVTLGEFTSGSTLLVFYAIFPLLFGGVFSLFVGKSDIWGSTKLAALSVLTMFFVTETIFILVPAFIAILLGSIAGHSSFRVLARSLVLAFAAFLLTVALFAPYVLSFLPILGYAANAASTQNLISDVQFTYSRATPLNVLRLAGNEGTGMRLLYYNGYDAWTVSGFASIILAGFALARLPREPRTRQFTISAALMLVAVATFVVLTFSQATYGLFNSFPLLFTFRNPRKLMFSVALGLSVLGAIGLDSVLERLRGLQVRRPRTRHLLAGLLLVLTFLSVFVYSWPVFLGDMGMRTVHPTFDTDHIIDRHFEEVSKIISQRQSEEGFFRTLWLPLDLTRALSLSWRDPYAVTAPAGAELYGTNKSWVSAAFQTLVSSDPVAAKLLGHGNVKRIVVMLNSDQKGYPRVVTQWNSIYLAGDPVRWVDLLTNMPGLRIEQITNSYAILVNDYFVPHVSITLERPQVTMTYSKSQTPGPGYWAIIEGKGEAMVDQTRTTAEFTNGTLSDEAYVYAIRLVLATPRSFGDNSFLLLNGLRFGPLDGLNVAMVRIRDNDTSWQSWFLNTSVTYFDTLALPLNSPDDSTYYRPNLARIIYVEIEARYSMGGHASIALGGLYLGSLSVNTPPVITSGYQWRQVSPTEYRVSTTRPGFIVLGESYNPSWEARSQGEVLRHDIAFGWANAFEVTRSENQEITIRFVQQRLQDAAFLLSMLAWITILSVLAYRRFETLRGILKRITRRLSIARDVRPRDQSFVRELVRRRTEGQLATGRTEANHLLPMWASQRSGIERRQIPPFM